MFSLAVAVMYVHVDTYPVTPGILQNTLFYTIYTKTFVFKERDKPNQFIYDDYFNKFTLSRYLRRLAHKSNINFLGIYLSPNIINHKSPYFI